MQTMLSVQSTMVQSVGVVVKNISGLASRDRRRSGIVFVV